MKYDTMNATVSGVTCEGKDFSEELTFKLLPPDAGTSLYGTGCYMRVITPYDKYLVDVRYERTTDIEILAERWIAGWYGENARDIVKQFPQPESSDSK